MAWCKSWKRALNVTHRKLHKDGVKAGGNRLGKKRRYRIDKGRGKREEVYTSPRTSLALRSVSAA